MDYESLYNKNEISIELIETKKNIIFSFTGFLDAVATINVEKIIMQKVIKIKRSKKIILDFDKLTYLSSIGVGLIFNIYKTHKNVYIKCANQKILNVLSLLGLKNIIIFDKNKEIN